MGQTLSTISKRAPGHHWVRFQEEDAFHLTLGLNVKPFSFVALPLKFISTDNFIRLSLQRRIQVREFRKPATPQER